LKQVNWNYKKLLFEAERSNEFIKEQIKLIQKKASMVEEPDY
jgi:hypothetical protein